MYWNPDMDVEEYLDYCREERIFPRYKGFRPFQELLKRGKNNTIHHDNQGYVHGAHRPVLLS